MAHLKKRRTDHLILLWRERERERESATAPEAASAGRPLIDQIVY